MIPPRISVLLIFLILLIALLVGFIWLQIFLSKKESKWPGLILPIITLAISLIVVLGLTFYSFDGTTAIHGGVDGPTEIHHSSNAATTTLGATWLAAFLNFLLFNISTGVLIAIYGACRSGRKRKQNLEKMKIQDL